LHWLLLPTKKHNRTLLFGSTIFKNGRHFDYWNQPLNMAYAFVLPRLSWTWVVLLSSGTRSKLITSITAVLLPFVA
jgi:hypothetical protein